MKKVPFYPNHPNGMYCVLAVYRSLFDYFFDEKVTFETLEKKARAEQGKAVWHLILDIELAKRGVRIVNIETIDYWRLYKEKEIYLKNLYDTQTAEYYLTESNIINLYDIIPKYLEHVTHVTKEPTVDDIDNLLAKGYIIGAEINSRILNNKPGFSLHYVLIQKGNEGAYVVHDPGLPPIENRIVSRDELEKSLANEITGFKL
jgi:hypothetical protein